MVNYCNECKCKLININKNRCSHCHQIMDICGECEMEYVNKYERVKEVCMRCTYVFCAIAKNREKNEKMN